MSWFGTHPAISKEEARQMLPPGACKRCVYYARCFPEEVLANYRLMQCSRCSTYSGAFYLFDTFGTPMLVPLPARSTNDAMNRTTVVRYKQKADLLSEDVTKWL